MNDERIKYTCNDDKTEYTDEGSNEVREWELRRRAMPANAAKAYKAQLLLSSF